MCRLYSLKASPIPYPTVFILTFCFNYETCCKLFFCFNYETCYALEDDNPLNKNSQNQSGVSASLFFKPNKTLRVSFYYFF